MKNKIIAGAALLAGGFLLFSSCASIPKKAQPVENFDINRYLGVWYEIARFDFRFEKNLDNTSAQYKLDKNGNVIVLNSGYTKLTFIRHSSCKGAMFSQRGKVFLMLLNSLMV